MIELMAENIGKSNSSDFFMLGLFSLIDAMLDNSMAYLMKQLPLTDSVKDALSKREGKKFPFLQAIEFYETGNWDKFEDSIQSIGIKPERVPAFYLDAVGWADSYQ